MMTRALIALHYLKRGAPVRPKMLAQPQPGERAARFRHPLGFIEYVSGKAKNLRQTEKIRLKLNWLLHRTKQQILAVNGNPTTPAPVASQGLQLRAYLLSLV
jgi:hypothetical protein